MKTAWLCMERIEAETSITLLETEQSDIAGIISERDAEYKAALLKAIEGLPRHYGETVWLSKIDVEIAIKSLREDKDE